MPTAERETVINKLGMWVIMAALGTFPLFFLPFTQDYYDTNKWYLLLGGSVILLGLWGLRVLTTKSLAVSPGEGVRTIGLLGLVALTSLLIRSPNKIEAMLSPFGVGTFAALAIFVGFGDTFFDEKDKHLLQRIMYVSISLTGLIAIYQFFGLGKYLLPNSPFVQNPLWTPVGTSVGLMTILAVTIPLLVREIYDRHRAGHDTPMIIGVVMVIACIGGLFITVSQMFPLWSTTTLPFWASWSLLLESYKYAPQTILGVGGENFLAAFTRGRPASLNLTPLWNTRFTMSSSMLFHIATIYGALGLAAFLYFLKQLVFPDKKGGHPTPVWIRISLWLAALALVLLPPSFPAFIVVVVLLWTTRPPRLIHRSIPQANLAVILGLVVLILVAGSSYGLVRAYMAEASFSKSLTKLDARDGTNAYNLQIDAITKNPSVSRYHMVYSQTNMAIAGNLANTATGSSTQSAEASNNRQLTTQLIQQAIREAKLAVNLAPINIIAWENLADIYQTLTGAAKGADQWTIASYQQAIQLDPTNPVLRLRLGGAYVAMQALDRARDSYLAAISLKPDFANAYYNLSFVYKQQKLFLAAAQVLKETQKYVTAGSDDATRIEKELAAMRELLTEKEKLALDAPAAAPPTTTPTKEDLAPRDNNTPLSPLP